MKMLLMANKKMWKKWAWKVLRWLMSSYIPV